VFSSKAQETLIVQGYLERASIKPSINFKKNMFCYFKGDYITTKDDLFGLFRVDSVISGVFLNFNNEFNQTPFYIPIAFINECIILNYQQNYTLRIKQIPHANYYYIDSLNQVLSDYKYSEKLLEHYKNYTQNVDVLTKGTLQERYELLGKMGHYDYTSWNADYRYISYILPFMTNKDSVTYTTYLQWSGWDRNGNPTGGVTEMGEEKELYSDCLYRYLNQTLPFALPNKTTDSIGWHEWYNSLFSKKECFLPIKYIQSKHRTIINVGYRVRDRSLAGYSIHGHLLYFIPDISSRTIYFSSDRKAYVFNMGTDEHSDFRLNCKTNTWPPTPTTSYENYSIQDNEIIEMNPFKQGISWSKLDSGAFCRQDDNFIPLRDLRDEERFNWNSVIHCNNDFLVFSSLNPDGYNCLKAGKANRKGEWIIKPQNLYTKIYKSYVGNNDDIKGFSFYQSNENETIFAFSDETYGRNSNNTNEKYGNAIIAYKLDAKLNVKDSIIFITTPPRSNVVNILKKDNTYLLLIRGYTGRHNQLHYVLLNDNLTPITDFIKLADNMDYNSIGKSIIISEGFMLSWIDNDLSEDVLRSVLITPSGKQSEIINITNQKIDKVYNIEFDKKHVDIYLFYRDEKTLIRKRIDKKEYKL
jgi:hypothetical protein